MKKLIKMPSIDQFRTVVSNIRHMSEYVGLDEKGEAKYNSANPKPTLTFVGTIKVHGTNAGASYNEVEGMWAQSKENIITVTQDNFGFAFFVETNKQAFLDLMNQVAAKENVSLKENTITIYGEWAGGSIQKGVAVSNIPKTFFIFGVKITPFNADVAAYWVESNYLKNEEHRIYNIYDFPTFTIEVDFNYPELIQNTIVEMVDAVEKECPVGKHFGFSGIGEGIVFSTTYKDSKYTFKAKGEKHSVTKVKKVASVDVEKVNSIIEFVDYAVTENRFNQALSIIFPNNEPIDVKKMGDLIRWVVNDIIKEESDTMVKNGIEPKEASKYISTKTRQMFFALSV